MLFRGDYCKVFVRGHSLGTLSFFFVLKAFGRGMWVLMMCTRYWASLYAVTCSQLMSNKHHAVPQGRSGRVRKISPLKRFDARTVKPVASRYTD
jgi:hypothetical protein